MSGESSATSIACASRITSAGAPHRGVGDDHVGPEALAHLGEVGDLAGDALDEPFTERGALEAHRRLAPALGALALVHALPDALGALQREQLVPLGLHRRARRLARVERHRRAALAQLGRHAELRKEVALEGPAGEQDARHAPFPPGTGRARTVRWYPKRPSGTRSSSR